MQGIKVSRAFFFGWALPWLQERYPQLVDHMAAGVFRGSQVFEADDQLSQDHGWGPEFTLFLTEEDYAAHGEALDADIATAPREWEGFKFRYPDRGITVTSIDRFFTQWLGWAQPPAEVAGWLMGDVEMREYELYLVRHGATHYDPLGAFAARRQAFHQYPEEVWLRRIHSHLFTVWHYGQYNFLDRLRHRGDPVAMQMALGHFTEGVMRLCLVLEGDFAPYWKWLAFEFRKRPIAAVLDHKLRALAATLDTDARCALISEISGVVHTQLLEHDLGYDGQPFHPHPLFCDMHRGRLQGLGW